MPKTAYSKSYKQELDVEQVVSLFKGVSVEASVELLKNIPDDVRAFVGKDVVCPSCGVENAILVSGSNSGGNKVQSRLAHFRFVSESKADAHRDFCEFSPLNDDSPELGGKVKFEKARTHEQKLIRSLVCRAIELKIFDQSDIRSMRQWYFDTKTTGSYKLNVSEKTFVYLYHLLSKVDVKEFDHHPSYAELPGYDWESAVVARVWRNNAKLIAAFHAGKVGRSFTEAINIVQKYQGKNVFSVAAMEPYYKKTLELCGFAKKHVVKEVPSRRYTSISNELLAFCSLLLSISNWDVGSAIEKLIKIVLSPEPKSLLLGNVIGLNPFHDYHAWRLIKLVGELEDEFDFSKDLDEQISDERSSMKAEYLEWRILHNLPALEEPVRQDISLNASGEFDEDEDIPF